MRVYRWLLAVLVIALLTYLSPHQRPSHIPELRIDSTAPDRIEATVRIEVPKNKKELENELLEAERSIPIILRYHPQVRDRELAHLDSVFSILLPRLRVQMPDSLKRRYLQQELPQIIGQLSEETLNTLMEVLSNAPPSFVQDFQETCQRILATLYRTGIIASKAEILNSVTQQVRIGDRELHVDALYSKELLKQGDMIPLIKSFDTIAARDAAEAIHELLGLFIIPNLTIDREETDRLRTDARRGVAKIKRVYVQGDVIVENGIKITQEHVDALNALAGKLAEQELQDPLKRLQQLLASLAFAAFITLIFGYYLAAHDREVYQLPGHLLLLAIIATSTVAIASYIRTSDWDTYLVPTPLAAMLMTILLNPQVGLLASLMLSFFVGILFGDFYIALICALTSAVAVYSVRQVRHRNQFFRSMIFLPASYMLLIAAGDFMRFVPLEEIDVRAGIFIGVAAPILTIGLLPVFESLFHITTDITLLELSDLNRPLLRDMAMRAPGTYTHSLIMANLSESAAEAIGANPLLARVGCYYHDIGKIIKPEYFSENQGLRGGRNPHDHLTPTMSVLVLSSHVKDGLELAEEYGLPRRICDLIPQHHGTTVIEYFYNRAIELGDESVREDDFRYDGPKPQTKEAGILMLADSVEGAARTLTERTPNRVRQLVRNIIQQKFNRGELDECDLTLQDLNKIEESFIPVLMGTLHGRVEYPWQKDDKKAQKSLANPV